MRKILLSQALAATICMGGVLSSCSETDGGQTPDTGNGNYVVSATAGDPNSQANYLIQAQALDQGSITTQRTGLETPTGTTWIFYKDQYLYRLQYNQGSAGVTTSYRMTNNQVTKRPKEYTISNRFTTYGIYGDKIITAAVVDTENADAQGNKSQGIAFTFLHVAGETTSTQTIAAENVLGTGEFVTFSGILEANGKIYTAVIPMGLSKYGVKADGGKWVKYSDLVATEDGGSGSGSYEAGELVGTQYPNEACVAIFDNDRFENPTLVRTNLISQPTGRNRSQYYQTVWADDQGNVYAFSPSYTKLMTDVRQRTTLSSSVARIKKGATTFDETYGAFNIEAASGGQPLFRCWHITGDYFLLQMYTQGLNSKGTGATKMAIFKGDDKSFHYVDGLPDANVISSFSATPYCENGVAYVGVATSDGAQPSLYKIDPVSHKAVKGLTVSATAVSAVGKLK